MNKSDRDEYEKHAKDELRYAKRVGWIRTEGDLVSFTVPLRGAIPSVFQKYLRHLTNKHWHGSLVAPEEENKPLADVHWAIGRGFEINVPVVFNLRTGELKLVSETGR